MKTATCRRLGQEKRHGWLSEQSVSKSFCEVSHDSNGCWCMVQGADKTSRGPVDSNMTVCYFRSVMNFCLRLHTRLYHSIIREGRDESFGQQRAYIRHSLPMHIYAQWTCTPPNDETCFRMAICRSDLRRQLPALREMDLHATASTIRNTARHN